MLSGQGQLHLQMTRLLDDPLPRGHNIFGDEENPARGSNI